jgi:hypothetical protein
VQASPFHALPMAMDVTVAGVRAPARILLLDRLASEGRVHMDDTTSDILDQADEDSLTPTVSDDALEAAAGMGGKQQFDTFPTSLCRPWLGCPSGQ